MTTNSQQAVTEAMVTAAMSAYDTVSADPVMIHCASCKGSGQVAVGDSPDWCSSCGGGGFDLAPGEELRPMRAALEAALSAQAQAKPGEVRNFTAGPCGFDDREFLQWIADRLQHVHGEPAHYDYMRRLRALVQEPRP